MAEDVFDTVLKKKSAHCSVGKKAKAVAEKGSKAISGKHLSRVAGTVGEAEV